MAGLWRQKRFPFNFSDPIFLTCTMPITRNGSVPHNRILSFSSRIARQARQGSGPPIQLPNCRCAVKKWICHSVSDESSSVINLRSQDIHSDVNECALPNRGPTESARGLAHSKTLRALQAQPEFAPASWTAARTVGALPSVVPSVLRRFRAPCAITCDAVYRIAGTNADGSLNMNSADSIRRICA